ncbi:MAG: redoxin domain-containing protein [Acidobacteria bacterium]|nr:redoxin domain-containing protein [Acidobacteriota bacterium]
MTLPTGQIAPDFILPSHLGTKLQLRDLRGRHVILMFFPLAWTPV